MQRNRIRRESANGRGSGGCRDQAGGGKRLEVGGGREEREDACSARPGGYLGG